MRNIELFFSPETEEVFVVINGLSVRERIRFYRLLQKFVVGLPFRHMVSVDSSGTPDALVLFR